MALDPTERLDLLSDIIISKVLQSDQDRAMITTQLNPEVFRNENFLIYKTLHNFRDSGIVPDKEFLTMYLTRNHKLILGNPASVDANMFMDTGDDQVTSFIAATVNKLVRLEKEDHSSENLGLILEKFKLDFKTIHQQRIYDTAKLILNDRYELGRKVYSGADDSKDYVDDEMTKLDSLINTGTGGGYIDASESGMSDDASSRHTQIGDFHKLDFLNEHLGGIKTGYMYNIMAPPKGGKSKFCYRLTHTAKVKYGTNVAFWSREGGVKKAEAELRAIHFEYYYNEQQGHNYTGLDAQMILDNVFPSEEYRELEAISRADFFTNENYGTLTHIDQPLESETYISHLKAVVNRFGVRFIVVDYLQLIKSRSGKQKNQVIGEAYQETLTFTKDYNVAYISPSQLSQEFIKEISKGKEADTRVGGGESAEIVRTPDVNLALYGTPEDIDNNKITFLSIPSRVAKPFEPTDIFIDLGYSLFADMPTAWEG